MQTLQEPAVSTGDRIGATRPRRVLALFNPTARTVAVNVSHAMEALRSRGFDVVAAELRDRASALRAIARERSAIGAVVALGGDGTLNAVLQGLVGTGLPLGALPLGTANDLCKTLQIPMDIAGACDVIAAGHTRTIDIGRVNGVYFFNEASIGLSVALCRRLTAEAKARFGVLAHIYEAFGIMRRMRRFRALVRIDGQIDRALYAAQLTIGNSRNFGGLLVNEEASIDDRRLDLYGIEFHHWWTYFEALVALLRHRYEDAKSVYTAHGRRFEVRTSRPMAIETDGEIVTRTPARFEIVPHAIGVFAPQERTPP